MDANILWMVAKSASRTTLKPKAIVAWYLQGNQDSAFLRWCEIDCATIRSMGESFLFVFCGFFLRGGAF